MPKLLAIFGATGLQGGSLIPFILADAELSKEYTIRAIVRDLDSEKAALLGEKVGVEVVYGDFTDAASIEAALMGVHTVFLVTPPSLTATAVDDEFASAKLVADIAVAKKVKYFIFSTLPHVSKISGGKHTAVSPFDAKALAEVYIRTLPLSSAFISLGSYMQNFASQPYLAPTPHPSIPDTYVMRRNMPSTAHLPLIDVVADIGKFVGAILAAPDRFEGSRWCCAGGLWSNGEIARALGESGGREVVYEEVGDGEFVEGLGFKGIGEQMKVLGGIFTEFFGYVAEFGYFGPGQEREIAWARKNARGEVTGLEEFLEREPVVLG